MVPTALLEPSTAVHATTVTLPEQAEPPMATLPMTALVPIVPMAPISKADGTTVAHTQTTVTTT